MDEITRVKNPEDAETEEQAPRLEKASRAGGPVTCVAFHRFGGSSGDDGDVARLWALGSYLFCSCRQLKSELLVFPKTDGGTIHGISFRDEKVADSSGTWNVAVFGGRQLAFCEISFGTSMDSSSRTSRCDILHDGKQKSHFIASDWIWDVKLFARQSATSVTAALGLSRHVVELWTISPAEGPQRNLLDFTFQRRITGSPSCLVTSMNIMQQERSVWVAAGTAFQVIQVWSLPMKDGGNEKTDSTLKYELEGHAGIIHSVRFSDNGRLIASTSDDRSVRLWSYSCENDVNEWKAKWVGWGHSARVWSVAFVTDALASVAEDATTRIWALESGAVLACVQHATGLWSIAGWNDVAMVGATNGSVSIINLSRRMLGRELEVWASIVVPDDRAPQPSISSQQPCEETEVSESNLATKTKQKKASKPKSQVIVGMNWLDQDQLLVATRAGSLMVYNFRSGEWRQCIPWWDSTLLTAHGLDMKDGCCMAIISSDWAAIGTTRGDIVVVKYNTMLSDDVDVRALLSAKPLRSVQGLKWIQEERILVSFHVHAVALWILPSDNQITALTKPTLTLNVDTKGVPTCCAHDGLNHMVVGDSRGSIALYQIPNQSPVGDAAVNASSSIYRIHQKEHVTSILLVGDMVVSSGNDGCLQVSYRNGSSLERGFSMPVSSLSGISQVRYQRALNGSRSFVVAGYFGNLYRLVDVVSGQTIFQIDTGGRQRIHDLYWPVGMQGEPILKQMAVCMSQKDGTNSLLVHREIVSSTSGKNLLSYAQDGVPVHGETIFDACFFSLGSRKSASFLLTASEDCGSKIFLCRENRLDNSIALTPQESCVRAVCHSQIDSQSALLAVGGGKLTLQFFLSYLRDEDPASVLEDVGIRFLGKRSKREGASIDQRINTVKAVPLLGPDRVHLVAAGDSAGQCHLYMISEDPIVRPSPGLNIQATTRPILSIAMSRIANRILLAIGTTAGDLALYDLPAAASILNDSWKELGETTWIPLTTLQPHQMGTNAISMSIVKTSETAADAKILTAGDDQAITYCRLKFTFISSDAAPKAVVESISTVPEASFSALKGISWLPGPTSTYFLAAGYTQRISLWKVVDEAIPHKQASLEVVDHLPVDVGDLNAIAATTNGLGATAAVVGWGIELFALSGTFR